MKRAFIFSIITLLTLLNQAQASQNIEVVFKAGRQHNHPLFAIWLADEHGTFIRTLYVSQSIGTSEFKHGQKDKGVWMPGIIQRPAALPYWGHQRGIRNEYGYFLPTHQHPEPDAISGATPIGSFKMRFSIPETNERLTLFLELNQSWDWNNYWHNNRYPNDTNYRSSCQPATVYKALIDRNKATSTSMVLVGHSHYNGSDGSLNSDLSSITTAKKIVRSIQVRVLPEVPTKR